MEPTAPKAPPKEPLDLSSSSSTERILFAYELALELAALYVCEMDARRTQAERDRPAIGTATTAASPTLATGTPSAGAESGGGPASPAAAGATSPTADSNVESGQTTRSQRHSELGPLIDHSLNMFPLVYMKYDPCACANTAFFCSYDCSRASFYANAL